MNTPTESGGRGRANLPAEERILDAILTEIATNGLANLSIDRVASRAAVSKATIYNRWRTKDEMVVAAFQAATAGPEEYAGDDLITSLRRLFEFGSRRAGDDRFDALVAELLAASHSNEQVRGVVADYRRRWYRATETMFRAALARGELPEDTDITFLSELVAGLITYRMITPAIDEVFDQATFRRVAALILHTPPRIIPD